MCVAGCESVMQVNTLTEKYALVLLERFENNAAGDHSKERFPVQPFLDMS